MEFQSPLDKRRTRLTMVLYTPGQSSGYPKNKVKDGIRFHFLGGGLIIMPIQKAKFSIGDIVKHKHFEFRGVIYDVDF